MHNTKEIFQLYLAGKCSPEQATRLLNALSEESFRAELELYIDEMMADNSEDINNIDDLNKVSRDQFRILESLIFRKEEKVKIYMLSWFRTCVVAAMVLIVFYWAFHQWKLQRLSNNESHSSELSQKAKSDQPKGLILTLSDGNSIQLSENKETPYSFTKTENGDSFVEIKKQENSKETTIQEITVPNGKTGAVILTDGTKVWLNAGSRLSYEVNFTGSTRSVNMQGEAYFEVAHDKKKPFVVLSGSQRIQVLGTHFNVKAYPDNKTITTLMAGSVEVSINDLTHILKPGESSIVNIAGTDIKIMPALMSKVNAWRNNEFGFYNASLDEIGKELSRWYGLEVSVIDKTKKFGFTGIISRTKSLNEVLEILNRTGQIKHDVIPKDGKERRKVVLTM